MSYVFSVLNSSINKTHIVIRLMLMCRSSNSPNRTHIFNVFTIQVNTATLSDAMFNDIYTIAGSNSSVFIITCTIPTILSSFLFTDIKYRSHNYVR